ncbi:uncharacterized protein [Mytilus edulis]|uniref:uncharacterized protein n=1 Tax=Mytilus edulis TaxID=6550 RepID=UPI0039F0ABE8
MNDDYQLSCINVNNLEKELAKHPDRNFVKYLLDGITNGFDTMVSKTELPTVECKNLQSAFRNPDSVDIIIKQEVDKGYLVGPFKKLPFDRYRVSPIGIVEGKYSGKKRLIVDLSSPHESQDHFSINDLIDKEQCSLSYVKIDDAINAIKEFGRLSILNKADIADAFKQLGIKRDQHHLYCIKWRNLYYYYVRLCFGSRSSPKIFDNLSVAICWIAKNNYNIPVILHLLDDFLTVQASDTSGDRTMALITLIFNRLNIPLSKKKTVGPHTTLEYLGIILDTDKMEARLPQDKVERIIYFIGTFLRRRSIKKRELLQLLGHFNFAARVIIPGRTFVTYLINLSTKVNNLNYYVTLSAECRDDLKMWYIFLKQWNCVSFFYDTFTTNSADFELFTDAASTLGFGGYFKGHWFCSSWPPELQNILDSDMSMAFRELYPIVVAAVLWGKLWTRKRIVFHCDNESTVNIINKGRSKVQDIMKLMRKLTWLAAINNFTFSSKHIPGVKNVIADSLSRFDFQTFRKEAPEADAQAMICPHFSLVMWN